MPHERGVIHRDLKPSNILLKPQPGSAGRPFDPTVSDFGLASRVRPVAGSNLTGTHDVIGTDPYVAPEQLDGGKGRAEPASDVFSLGVILYELVAGRRPFDGETADETRNLIRNDEPPSISAFRPSVPRDLSTIIAKCLQKSPAARYSSAGQLADDLRRFINHEPILARRIPAWQRAWKYSRRKPYVVSLVLLTSVSVMVVASLLGALVANRLSASRRIDAAEAVAALAERMERERLYAATIRQADEALRRTGPREALALLEQCPPLARGAGCGIEWDLLRAHSDNADRSIPAHSESINVVRFSPDGKFLASAGEDAQVTLWNTMNWTKWQQFDHGDEDTNAVEFSADGQLLAVAGDDGKLVVLRLEDGATVFDERVVEGRAFELAWLGKTHEVAVGGEDAILRVIDVDSSARRSMAAAPTRAIYRGTNQPREEIDSLAFLPDRNAIAVTTSHRVCYLADAGSLNAIRHWFNPLGGGPMCYVPKGPGYLTICGDRALSVYNAETGVKVAEVETFQHARSIRYLDSARSLVVFFRDGTVAEWAFDAILAGRHVPRERYTSNSGRTFGGDVSPDGMLLVSGAQNGEIKLWQRKHAERPFDVTLSKMPWTAKYSPDGRWLAIVEALVGDAAARVTLFDVAAARSVWSADSQGPPPNYFRNCFVCEPWAIDFADDGDEVVFSTQDNAVCGYDTKTGLLKKKYLPKNPTPVDRIQALPDGKHLFVTRLTLDRWIVGRTTGNVERPFVDRDLTRIGMLRTHQGDQWLLSDNMSRAKYLSATTPDVPEIKLDGGYDRDDITAAISRDGRYLAIGGEERVVNCWDLTAPGRPTKFVGHESGIVGLCFSSDGRTILSHGADGTVRFWHVATGTELLKLGTPEEPITCMGLSPAGNLLVLGVERNGHYGLQLHRLGRDRDSLPRSFTAPSPVGESGL